MVATTVSSGRDPEAFDLTPDGTTLLVSNEDAGRLAFIDAKTARMVGELDVGAEPEGVALRPDGKVVIDTAKHLALEAIDLKPVSVGPNPPRPMGMAFAPDGERLYVTTGRGGGVAVIDARTNQVEATISGVGPRPWGIAPTRDGRRLYVACGPSNDVAVIDTITNTVLGHVKVGRSPWGVVVGGR